MPTNVKLLVRLSSIFIESINSIIPKKGEIKESDILFPSLIFDLEIIYNNSVFDIIIMSDITKLIVE